jgi:hypothetical protein
MTKGSDTMTEFKIQNVFIFSKSPLHIRQAGGYTRKPLWLLVIQGHHVG